MLFWLSISSIFTGLLLFPPQAHRWLWLLLVFLLFSSIRRALRAFKLAFSDLMRACSASNSFILTSISSIFTRFLSRAFCAATLFLSFRRISFSSGDKWSKLARFLVGWSLSSSSAVTADAADTVVLTVAGAGLLVALMVGSWTTLAAVAWWLEGANLKMVACCSLPPLPELRRRLLGSTMICCCCCWPVAAAMVVCGFCWRGEGLTTNFFIVGCWLVDLASLVAVANSTIILVVSIFNHE